MKVIFFDIDGVLNSNKFICNNPGETVDRKNVKSPVTATTAAIVPTFSQVMPEKLPIDQLCRLTISESSAKVTRKSVTAEQI